MTKLRAWIQASRLPASANVAVPLLYGQALAYALCGSFSWEIFLLLHLFGVADQLFIVYANDVADADSDAVNETYNAFSGGSRVLVEGKLTRLELLAGAAFAAAAMAAVTVHLAIAYEQREMLGVLAAAYALLWAYSFRPLRLAYRGGGEWLQAVGVGIVLPYAGFVAQCGTDARVPWLALAPSLLLGLGGHVTTALPDAPADAATGKRTIVVRIGERNARLLALASIAGAVSLTPVVFEAPSVLWIVGVVFVPAFALSANLGLLGRADAENRAACREFVLKNGVAITGLYVAWSAALVALS